MNLNHPNEQHLAIGPNVGLKGQGVRKQRDDERPSKPWTNEFAQTRAARWAQATADARAGK